MSFRRSLLLIALLGSIASAHAELYSSIQSLPIQLEVSDEKWKKIADEEGVKVYEEKAPQEDVVGFRGEATVETTLLRIGAVLRDESLRKDWIDALQDMKVLEKYTPLDQTEYQRTGLPWPCQDRDFVYRGQVTVFPKDHALFIEMKSIDDPRAPVKKDVVRGKLVHAFYFMKENPETHQTRVVIEMAVDPGGKIPKWLVNNTQRRWPHHTFRALKKVASRTDLVVPKDIQDYFKDPSIQVIYPNLGEKK